MEDVVPCDGDTKTRGYLYEEQGVLVIPLEAVGGFGSLQRVTRETSRPSDSSDSESSAPPSPAPRRLVPLASPVGALTRWTIDGNK